MGVLLEPIKDDIKDLKWLISDLDINTSEIEKLPINHEKDWFLISSDEMELICKTDTQIVWGVFSGIDKNVDLKTDQIEIPYADGNGEVWKNGNLQVENSKIEIIAWDSSYTIVKFTKREISDKFKKYFDEAIELEEYKFKK
ncbi:hypothetical protein [Flammeovirga agarivorans]|uniref:Uncharacterized protein n=1 Tax=Flammeovirga agarivorans TaxID=2726742 RepID=A0A7X8XZG1_9BACT|nr:hypothetical protein [Flammeovirga agarivorans]NLR95147.1 hypothetical protein [Flammeovirga agarivorans]